MFSDVLKFHSGRSHDIKKTVEKHKQQLNYSDSQNSASSDCELTHSTLQSLPEWGSYQQTKRVHLPGKKCTTLPSYQPEPGTMSKVSHLASVKSSTPTSGSSVYPASSVSLPRSTSQVDSACSNSLASLVMDPVAPSHIPSHQYNDTATQTQLHGHSDIDDHIIAHVNAKCPANRPPVKLPFELDSIPTHVRCPNCDICVPLTTDLTLSLPALSLKEDPASSSIAWQRQIPDISDEDNCHSRADATYDINSVTNKLSLSENKNDIYNYITTTASASFQLDTSLQRR